MYNHRSWRNQGQIWIKQYFQEVASRKIFSIFSNAGVPVFFATLLIQFYPGILLSMDFKN